MGLSPSEPRWGWVGVSLSGGGPGAVWGHACCLLAPCRGGLLWEGGLERRQMFEQKNVHYCLKLLRAAREAALAPRGKPQS